MKPERYQPPARYSWQGTQVSLLALLAKCITLIQNLGHRPLHAMMTEPCGTPVSISPLPPPPPLPPCLAPSLKSNQICCFGSFVLAAPYYPPRLPPEGGGYGVRVGGRGPRRSARLAAFHPPA